MLIRSLLFALLVLLFSLPSCVAPINSSYESARTLERGRTELSGHYTSYRFSSDGESETTNNNIGFRVGYGLSDKVDLKFRVIHLFSKSPEEETDATYLSIAPKFSLLPNVIALSTPFGAYLYKVEGNVESTFFISPQFLFTFSKSQKFDLTFASKIDVYLEEDSESTIGFNLGCGLSEDLNNWAIRPELGLLFDPGEEGVYFNFGIGFVYVLGAKQQLAPD